MSDTSDASDRAYTNAAAHLIPRFEALASQAVLAPIDDLLPPAPARLLDIGAGTGRDAAWLAACGYDVTAVEPVEALRSAGQSLHRTSAITWIDDRLPHLSSVGEVHFDIILIVAVWQHVAERELAMDRLRQLLARQGRLFVSLRHGPDVPDEPVFACDPDDAIAMARDKGLRLLHRVHVPSVDLGSRAAGVHWTWLALEAD